MNDSSIKSGTIFGTLLALLGIVGWTEIIKTIVLGGIGAVVSFVVSLALRKMIKQAKELIETRAREQKNNGNTKT